MLRYQGVPKRQLLKDVYRGWRSFGVRPRRGKVFPPLRIGKETLALLYELAQKLTNGRLDVANITPEEVEADMTAIIREWQQTVR
jgi:hypothetical protein